MRSKLMNGALALVFLLTIVFQLFAAEPEGVVVEMKHQKVVKGADGKEKHESAGKAKPGDVIEYKAVYRNKGKREATSLLATIPIPLGTDYIPGSAKPEKILASLDGASFAPAPLKREVTLPSGAKEMRTVPVEEYRAIRWELNTLAPGKSATVSVRVRLSTEPEKK